MSNKAMRSHCPINFALESFGDMWSLLILRDIVFWGKHSFKEFQESKEGIATNILTDRLSKLVASEILVKSADKKDGRRSIYTLSEKGLDLIPMLCEISGWSSIYDDKTTAPKEFVQKVRENRTAMYSLMRHVVGNGGSFFAGEGSVVEKMQCISSSDVSIS